MRAAAIRNRSAGSAWGSLSRLLLHEDRVADGLGIGLSHVRTLVQMHGCAVEAFSEGPGKGSRFMVRLPTVEEGSAARWQPPANVQWLNCMPGTMKLASVAALRVTGSGC